MEKFFAIDVETANADYSSICQIGIVEFQNGEIVNSWKSLINPEDYFDGMNISIHGITEKMVKNSPTFIEIYDKLKSLLENNISIHHMPFDKIAINRVCEKYQVEEIETNWLDSAKIVRRAWEEFAYSGYGLSKISKHLGINFQHHDALEDAIAAGKVVLAAIQKTGMQIEDWLLRVNKPIKNYTSGSSIITLDGNPEGPLHGENIVFTGTLFISRYEAAKMAAELGCNVNKSVTKKTTLIVVGTQDDFKLAGYEKSSKHRKAEELISKGAEIRILSEDDFKTLTKEKSTVYNKGV